MTKKIDPKEKILTQGFDTIIEEGVRFFTVESLAGKLGMSKKTIYKFFPTKEKLIEEIVLFYTKMVEKKFKRIIASDMEPTGKFMAIMEFIMNTVGRISIEKMMDVKMRYPGVWKKIEDFRLARQDDFAAILIEAQEKGLARSDMDMKKVATIYMNIVNSTFQPEFFLKNNLAPKDAIRIFVDMITRGLFTPRGVAACESYKQLEK
ncbi:MAG: TetR/AcrR family transcriptional regulator [FCB group bacterium]|nr:TetR/AcrR family transcriptional regulator [FCB group bacterium]